MKSELGLKLPHSWSFEDTLTFNLGCCVQWQLSTTCHWQHDLMCSWHIQWSLTTTMIWHVQQVACQTTIFFGCLMEEHIGWQQQTRFICKDWALSVSPSLLRNGLTLYAIDDPDPFRRKRYTLSTLSTPNCILHFTRMPIHKSLH